MKGGEAGGIWGSTERVADELRHLSSSRDGGNGILQRFKLQKI